MWDFIEEQVDSASNSVSDWLGDGADASGPATATHGTDAQGHEPDSWWGNVGQTVGDFGRGLRQEGISGLLDPTGMIDRQDAQRDLASRFQVVGDDFVGPRNHNQVSQEEYEDIARTYSNVRMGRGDLTIDSSEFDNDEDREAWEQDMMNNVADIMMTTSGRRQINNLSNNVLRDDSGNARLDEDGDEQHHSTTLSPLFQKNATEFNASTLRSDNANATPQSGGSFRNDDGSRGDGTDSVVRWNNFDISDMRSDVVLAHELQHAYTHTQGTRATGRYNPATGGVGTDANRVYADGSQGIRNSERQTVGVSRTDSPTGGHYPGDEDGCTENTYRFERNQLGLGERHLPRSNYRETPGQAGSDEELRQAWEDHEALQQSELERLGNRP